MDGGWRGKAAGPGLNRDQRVCAALFAAACALLVLALAPAVSHAAPCDAPVTNPVACENTKAGAPANTWEADGVGDESIQGFATEASVNKGEQIQFKIKSATANYRIDIFRLGYYGGAGARLIQSNLTPTGSATQPACQTFSASGLIDCGNWSVSRAWTVPSTAVSGVYIANLVRNDTGGNSHIPFVVRDDASTSPILMQTNDATWQAYNDYGGNSLYKCTTAACPNVSPDGYYAALKVSYNRPYNTASGSALSWLMSGGEYPMIRFVEANGYNVSYFSQVDTETRPALIRNHKMFMSAGHDEYWSQNQRSNVEAARDAGVNLSFFSGNEMFWKTRYEPSSAGTAAANRTLVSYKDTHFDAAADPVSWTGTWRDRRFVGTHEPENALTGQSFVVNSGTSNITVPAAYKSLRLWRNTAVQGLSSGQSLMLAPSTLGYEWDEDPDNGFRPAGSFRVSSTTVSGVEVFTDLGTTTGIGTATHNMTTYRAPSGALVFGAGTVQWSWGLDNYNQSPGVNPDQNMRQATVNLFADMDAQPMTRQAGLVAATKSTDTTKPTSTISSPAANATLTDGTSVTVSGTATDGGGGVVAGVEISTDDGATWHPATGTTSWTYSWVVHGAPSTKLRTRAVDDSANLEVPGVGRTVNVSCSCSIWGNAITPPAGNTDSGDASSIELGVRFRSDTFGQITGLRFYKASANTGTHIGSLWSESGTLLSQVVFTSETASGWQRATFSSPVQIEPNTTYIASYHAPNGHYAASSDYLYRKPAPGPNGGSIADGGPLHAERSTDTSPNGLFAYGSGATFPTGSYRATNYWVDVEFEPIPAPGGVTNVSASPGGTTSANVTWDAPTTGGPPTSYTITPRVNGVAQTPKTITGSPPLTSTTVTGLTTGITYTFTVRPSNPVGSGPESSASNAVTPLNAVPPSVPTGVTAKAGSQAAKVTWTTPASDGDSAITGYTITPYVGATAQTAVQAGASATSHTVTGLTNGTAYTFRVKATNGVGSSPDSSPTAAVTPQATIFDFSEPQNPDSGDPNAVEIGVKFTADLSGTITGVRFFKAAANIGTHTGSLWTTGGTRLAQATFTNESSSGWQVATFATPVNITAGTTYIASYHAPTGHYSATTGAFQAGGVDNGALHALANSTSPNGVYMYGATSAFPSNTYNGANYWVDVTYALPTPGQVTGASAVEAGQTSATVSWTAPATGGPVTSYVVTPHINGVAQTPKVVTGTPLPTSTTVTGLTSGTTYTFTVAAGNANGTGPQSAPSNAVTPQTAVAPTAPTGVVARPATSSVKVEWTTPAGTGDSPITGYTITPYIGATAQTPVQAGASATSVTISGLTNGTTYTFRVVATNAVGNSPQSAPSNAATPRYTIFDHSTPATADSGDPGAVELGVKFTPSAGGTITGVRFYKSALNTGTHTGSVWTTSGTRLAQATFTNESTSGWQTAVFATPVAVSAGTTYVASYFAPSGHYSVTSGGISSTITNGPLSAPAGSNGVYAYGPSSTFPSGTYNAANYWVDPMFAYADAPGAPGSVTATAGQTSAQVSWNAPTTGGPPMSYTVTPRIGGVAQTPKTVDGTPLPTSTTVTGLTAGTSYTFTVTASNLGGTSAASAPSNAVTPSGATVPSAPTNVTAGEDSTAANINWTAPASTGGSPISQYVVTPFAGATAQPSTTVGAGVTATKIAGLTNGTSYTFRVTARNGVGDSPASAASAAVTPRLSIFVLGAPATVDSGDNGSVNLGVRFTSDVAGSITGVRFYKSDANTGSHVGSLWASDGTLLQQGTFSNELASGWQTVTFATPVNITAGTTYIASYLAPNGRYSVTGSGFGSAAVDNPPLHALRNTALAGNGLYRYGASSLFPTNSYNSANYWVDVLFAPDGA